MIRFLTAAILLLFASASFGSDAIVIKARQSAKFITPENVEGSLVNWTAIWLDLLTSAGMTADTAGEEALTGATQGKLLILPNATHLSDDQLAGLQMHLNGGDGALLTWATATRDQNDNWRGWGFLEESTGGSIVQSKVPSRISASLQMRSAVPGGCALPPGYYLRLTPYIEPLQYIPGDSSAIAGYWSADGYKESLLPEWPLPIGAVARQRPTAGRIYWIGANIDGMHVDSSNRVMAIKWAREVLYWLKGGGVVQISPWPEGVQTGMLIHGDIEDQFDKVQRITSVFRRIGVPSTYNILTNEASRAPAALQAILSTKHQLSAYP